MWLCQNDFVFNGKTSSPMQVVYLAQIGFIYGLCFNILSANCHARRCVCGWSGWSGRFLPNMDGNIISGSVHILLRHRHSCGSIWNFGLNILITGTKEFVNTHSVKEILKMFFKLRSAYMKDKSLNCKVVMFSIRISFCWYF